MVDLVTLRGVTPTLTFAGAGDAAYIHLPVCLSLVTLAGVAPAKLLGQSAVLTERRNGIEASARRSQTPKETAQEV